MRATPLASVLAACLTFSAGTARGGEATNPAVNAINAFGLDLLHLDKSGTNFLISPYSIQTALVMTYAGADGETKREMEKALHYNLPEDRIHQVFSGLQRDINAAASKEPAPSTRPQGDPMRLLVANRLFGKPGYPFRPEFLSLVKDTYDAPLETVDFTQGAAAASHINSWVESKTNNRIKDLLMPEDLDILTRLVLVNAVYLKASWESEFRASGTAPRAFRLGTGESVDVPTMNDRRAAGHEKREGYSVIVLPYAGDLQFVAFLPDTDGGLAALEARLAPDVFPLAALPRTMLNLFLPKFRMEPPRVDLAKALTELGMKSAFSMESANFDRIAPRQRLYITKVFHKTFINLDEKGTEAAAATAVIVGRGGGAPGSPIEVHLDHPFLFAIQHRSSGAVLFLGRVVDPR